MSRDRLSAPLPAFLLLISLLVFQLAVFTSVRAEQDTCPFDGGFSSRVNASTCPPAAPVNCGTGLQPRCCPTGTQCAGDGLYEDNYCCSADDSTNASITACIEDIVAYPRCSVSSWGLFNINGSFDHGAFCCLEDYNGTYLSITTGSGYGVRCVPAPTSSDEDPPLDYEDWAEYVVQDTCTSASSSTTGTATATASTITTASSAATSSTTSSASGSKVSGGAIGGIVVGCVAGVALVAVAVFFVWRRRHAKEAELPTPQEPGAYDEAKYMPVQQTGSPTAPIELGTHFEPPPAELDSTPR